MTPTRNNDHLQLVRNPNANPNPNPSPNPDPHHIWLKTESGDYRVSCHLGAAWRGHLIRNVSKKATFKFTIAITVHLQSTFASQRLERPP